MSYLTDDLPGIGGRIRETLQDFHVEEVPLYDPCGEGTHVYFRLVKAGIPTPAALERIARYMGVRPGEIGVAGLKDAQATTSQLMSLEHADAEKLKAYRDKQVKITGTWLHTNKLRPGHLSANRFGLAIRGVEPDSLPRAQAILDVLARRGAPNYFGPQRFGARGDTDRLGEALVRGDLDEFVAILLGRPRAEDPPDCKAARDAFDNDLFDRALKHWPRHYSNERRALSAYRKKRRAGPAVGAVDKRMKRLYVSALQSAVFNECLGRRIDEIDRMQIGDLAKKHDSGGVFTVEDLAAEQPRAEAFEISPTGPIVGYRASLAEGLPGQVEREILSARKLGPDDFRNLGPLKAKGSRRAFRFKPAEPSLTAERDESGEYLKLTFTAPSGCYATSVLREIMKDG